MTSLLLVRFGRYLIVPVLILIYTLGVGFVGYRWGRAGAELAYAEAQLDLSQQIRRADERIERASPSQASIDTILKRLDRYAVVVSFSALLLVGCGDKDQVHIHGDTPEPYHLSRCTQEFMKAQHAANALPRCVAVDWNEVTDLNLKLEARRKLEGTHGDD